MPSRSRALRALVVTASMVAYHGRLGAQTAQQPTNDLPNPYQTIEGWAKLPEGRTWGSTSAVDIDRNGTNIWVAERCGANSCAGSTLDPVLEFDATGKLLKSFGAGMFVSPHGIFIDKDDNIWVTDCACTGGGGRGRRGGGAGAAPEKGAGGGGDLPNMMAQMRSAVDSARGGRGQGAPAQGAPATVGHQIYKFNKDGKLLMTLGKAGGDRDSGVLFQPNDVLVAPNGDIFVAEGHSSNATAIARLLKFSKDGTLIKSYGSFGPAPDQLDQPHALAMDSKGRLFVGDRGNNRILIFDQDFRLLDTWYQFSRPSGIYIDKDDHIYVADSESGSVNPAHGAWKRGIRIGSAKDGTVQYFIPDPDEKATNTSAAEGVAIDAHGNIYGAEVGPKDLKRYVKK